MRQSSRQGAEGRYPPAIHQNTSEIGNSVNAGGGQKGSVGDGAAWSHSGMFAPLLPFQLDPAPDAPFAGFHSLPVGDGTGYEDHKGDAYDMNSEQHHG